MNKQRLTLLSRKEKKASAVSGWVNSAIPDATLRQRLADEPGVLHVEEIIAEIAHQAGRLRSENNARLKPSEVRVQAAETLAVIDELISRLRHMHPSLKTLVNEQSRPTLIQADLKRLRGAISTAESRLATGTTGPRTTTWSTARDAIAESLRCHAKPVMARKQCRAIAAELLGLAGFPNPRSA